MKFEIGQNVIVLDTEFKPAGNAIVRKYEVSFVYPDKSMADNIIIPEERLLLPSSYKG